MNKLNYSFTHFQPLLRVSESVFSPPFFSGGLFLFIFGALTTILLSYTIDIEAMSCPRPRLGRYGNAHNTPKYKKYKEAMVFLLKALRVPKADYSMVFVEFFFPYSKSVPKKNRIDNAPARHTRYDLDNLLKAFLDNLQDAGIIENDRCICTTLASKIYTTQERGRIRFDIK